MPQTVGKKELVDEISTACAVSKSLAGTMVNVLADYIKNSVSEGKIVQLRGLFTVKPVKRAAREGRNPNTGEKIAVPEKTVAKFSAGFDIQ